MIASQSYDPLHYGVLSSDDLRVYYTTEKGRSQEKTCYSNPERFALAVFKSASFDMLRGFEFERRKAKNSPHLSW